MTIEEYLVDVREIYYQLSVRVHGKQLLALGKTHRLTNIRDGKGALGMIRFSTLSLPATTEIDRIYSDRAVIYYGGVRLVIWPVKEMSNDRMDRRTAHGAGPVLVLGKGSGRGSYPTIHGRGA